MSTNYGFNPHVTLLRALWIVFWVKVIGDTSRGIGYAHWPHDKNNQHDEELRYNQLYGLDVLEAAYNRLGMKGPY